MEPRILIACEFSGVVRTAFRSLGYQAWSCDVLPIEDASPYHLQCDVRDLLCYRSSWSMMIGFPPCTHLCASGARWWKQKAVQQQDAITFVQCLLQAPVPHIVIENPVGILSRAIRRPDQIIQPWQYGHGETKATCLWLKNLPLLQPTRLAWQRESLIHKMPQTKDRWIERSRTYAGVAMAMAEQWGKVLAHESQ